MKLLKGLDGVDEERLTVLKVDVLGPYPSFLHNGTPLPLHVLEEITTTPLNRMNNYPELPN
jgi:hypothetical protein